MFQKASRDANESDVSFRLDEVELKLRCYGFVTKAINYSLVDQEERNGSCTRRMSRLRPECCVPWVRSRNGARSPR